MSRARLSYTMTRKIFRKILTREGKPPTCRVCGRILAPGMKVLTKMSRNKTMHTQRYCSKCRARLKIWI